MSYSFFAHFPKRFSMSQVSVRQEGMVLLKINVALFDCLSMG